MSVKFDRTNLGNAGDWLLADNTNLAPTSFAFSISLWVYFHVAIGGRKGEEKVSGTIDFRPWERTWMWHTQRRHGSERRRTCSANS
jgi:hypothetical protein